MVMPFQSGSSKHAAPELTIVAIWSDDVPERRANIEYVLNHLMQCVDCEFIIAKITDDPEDTERLNLPVRHQIRWINDAPLFNRSYFLNKTYDLISTPFAAFVDADCVIPIDNIMQAIGILRSGESAFVLPYNHQFVYLDKEQSQLVRQSINSPWDFNQHAVPGAVGGSMFFRVDDFERIGRENEKFVGWGRDDDERWSRIQRLSTVKLCSKPIYHLYHERLNAAFYRPTFFNDVEAARIVSMSTDALYQEIKKWTSIHRRQARVFLQTRHTPSKFSTFQILEYIDYIASRDIIRLDQVTDPRILEISKLMCKYVIDNTDTTHNLICDGIIAETNRPNATYVIAEGD